MTDSKEITNLKQKNANRITELKEKNLKRINDLKQRIPHIGVLQEFKDFLKEYKVIGLAVAFIMAAAATTLVQSLVNNIIMPLATPFIPKGEWQTATLILGPFAFGWGSFLGALINFIILAIVVFLLAKMILREERVTRK